MSAELLQAMRERKSAKLATAREAARALLGALAVEEPDLALVEGAILDVVVAMGEREGLEDAIDLIEDVPS